MPGGGKKLEQGDIIKLQKEFLDCDGDGDGTITVAELRDVLRGLKVKLKVSDSDIKKILREIDADGDGTVNLKEYYDHMANSTNKNLVHRALMQRSKARQQFAKYDTDGSGSISVEEMKLVFEERTGRKLDMKEVKQMLKFERHSSELCSNFIKLFINICHLRVRQQHNELFSPPSGNKIIF